MQHYVDCKIITQSVKLARIQTIKNNIQSRIIFLFFLHSIPLADAFMHLKIRSPSKHNRVQPNRNNIKLPYFVALKVYTGQQQPQHVQKILILNTNSSSLGADASYTWGQYLRWIPGVARVTSVSLCGHAPGNKSTLHSHQNNNYKWFRNIRTRIVLRWIHIIS